MSCVVAWAEDGVVYMGGDSWVVQGYVNFSSAPKVFRIETLGGPIVAGMVGSMRAFQLIQYSGLFEAMDFRDKNPEEYLCHFMIKVANYCKEHKHEIPNEEDRTDNVAILLGIDGQIWQVGDFFDVFKPQIYKGVGISAIGVGAEGALCALDVLADFHVDSLPRTKLEVALRITARRITNVRDPFHFVDTLPNTAP